VRFERVLVANRGEVAFRVLRAAHEVGLSTVAIYSEVDRGAPYLEEADQAVLIGPAAARESYLSIDAILAAAHASGADAVHPGYGFLAENAEFARRCEQDGLVFIGPPAEVVDQMGRKDQARRLATEIGLPVAAGIESDDLDVLADRARRELGLPLIVKAVAGGGGKAMRVVRDDGELDAALSACRRESLAAFGDDALLVERYLDRARHIEVQVLADTHGNVVHLFERECSLQRRHQKVVEEAPATAIPSGVRAALHAHAVNLARGIGYVNAGTVEFLVDGDEVVFLEMNTRLQVEHRVTELVCGLDLVGLQFAIANGDPLPFTQADLRTTGHAIEARVYAEDPAAGYLPQSGVARVVRWPRSVLVDESLRSGQQVTTHYDPMLAKIVAHGVNRAAARSALIDALDETVVIGVMTNVGHLRTVVASGAFADAQIDTGWLERHLDDFVAEPPGLALVAAAWSITHPDDRPAAFANADNWRLAGPPGASIVELTFCGTVHELWVEVESSTVSAAGRAWRVTPITTQAHRLTLEIDDGIERFFVLRGPSVIVVVHGGTTFEFTLGRVCRPDLPAPTSGAVRAPLPGVIVAVGVAKDDVVTEGAVLVTVESMKTEFEIRAPFGGTIDSLQVEPGEHVALEQVIAVVRPDDE
jgi:acetyl-CoA/propionyl-CoA carboxylase biotin carboxyl carrier protein